RSHPRIGIIGAGRAGAGLGLALSPARYSVRLHGRRKQRVPRPLTLTIGNADEPPAWVSQVGVVVLAVPDDAIRAVAESLAKLHAITHAHTVLHVSGVHGQEALAPLRPSRAALGSLHPLQTISDPRTAPE